MGIDAHQCQAGRKWRGITEQFTQRFPFRAKVPNWKIIIGVYVRGVHTMETYETISKYDRRRAGLQGHALFTRPSTVKVSDVTGVTGRAETFVVDTAREPEQGDYIFIECVDESAHVTRLCLPPKVADAIAGQRDSLTARRRSAAAQRLAAERKAAGIKPGFMTNPGWKKRRAK